MSTNTKTFSVVSQPAKSRGDLGKKSGRFKAHVDAAPLPASSWANTAEARGVFTQPSHTPTVAEELRRGDAALAMRRALDAFVIEEFGVKKGAQGLWPGVVFEALAEATEFASSREKAHQSSDVQSATAGRCSQSGGLPTVCTTQRSHVWFNDVGKAVLFQSPDIAPTTTDGSSMMSSGVIESINDSTVTIRVTSPPDSAAKMIVLPLSSSEEILRLATPETVVIDPLLPTLSLLPLPHRCPRALAMRFKTLLHDQRRPALAGSSMEQLEAVASVIAGKAAAAMDSAKRTALSSTTVVGNCDKTTSISSEPISTSTSSSSVVVTETAESVSFRCGEYDHTVLKSHAEKLRVLFLAQKRRLSTPRPSNTAQSVTSDIGNITTESLGDVDTSSFVSFGDFSSGSASDDAMKAIKAEFGERVFVMLHRYWALAGGRPEEEAGWHGGVPRAAFAAMASDLGAGCECFASPLNATFTRFCSAFVDTDAVFGSLGSFFSLDLAKVGGVFESNPPFDQAVAVAMAHRMHNAFLAIESAERASETASSSSVENNITTSHAGDATNRKEKVPLSFVIVLPWADKGKPLPSCAAVEAALATPFLRCGETLPYRDAPYVDGMQQCQEGACFTMRLDTRVFVLQNDAAAAKWPAEVGAQKVKEAWAAALQTDESASDVAAGKRPRGE